MSEYDEDVAARLEMMMWRVPYRKASKVERVKMILAALKPGNRLPGGLRVVPGEPTEAMLGAIAGSSQQDNEAGIEAQRRLGFKVVPPVAEYQHAYGQYQRLLKAASTD